MVKITCDKCECAMYQNPMQQAILPSYMISKLSGYNLAGQINLCPDCEKKFTEWLNSKE